MSRDSARLFIGIAAVAVVTLVATRWLHVENPATVAMMLLLVVLLVAATSRIWVAVTTSIVAASSLNYFFLPPVGSLSISGPHNWVVLFVFLAVSLVASNLSSVAVEERKTAEVARKSEELKSVLLASLAHDLRTPLTAIRVAASNLQASWLSAEERFEQSQIVLAEVERLTRMFHNILEMARIDAGGISTEPRWVDPAEVVAAARDQIVHALDGRTLTVEGDASRLVRLDPRLTAAALSHVLENAAQYTPAGSPIAVNTVVSDHELVVTVSDRGPGIAQADLPRLFERFFRGRASKPRVSGTGMGLAIAQGLLAAASGRIQAENRPGGGAIFTITVPVQSRTSETAEKPS